jgi:hypothetical protein
VDIVAVMREDFAAEQEAAHQELGRLKGQAGGELIAT